MEIMKKEFELLTAADFFDKLQQDKLDTAKPFSIIGMVKKSGEHENSLEFAFGGNCSNWISIPIELIENVEVMETISCKDHSHPLVKLIMTTPKTSEGKFFLALLENFKQTNAFSKRDHDVPNSGSKYPEFESMTPSTMARFGGGKFGRFGGGLSVGFGSTLPTCSYEKHIVPCGSPSPGNATPMCEEYWYCCTWPNGSRSCI